MFDGEAIHLASTLLEPLPNLQSVPSLPSGVRSSYSRQCTPFNLAPPLAGQLSVTL